MPERSPGGYIRSSIEQRMRQNLERFSHRSGGIQMRNPISRSACHGIAVFVFMSILSVYFCANAADAPPARESEKTAWYDESAHFDFVMDPQTLAIRPGTVATDGKADAVRCILVVPKRAAPGNPWSWRDLYRDR